MWGCFEETRSSDARKSILEEAILGKSEEIFALVKGVCHLKAFLAASLTSRSVIVHSVPPTIPERDALSEASEEAAEGLAAQNYQVTTEEPENEWASHSEAWCCVFLRAHPANSPMRQEMKCPA